MDKQALKQRCQELYGAAGERLYAAMMALHEKDFCVATAWDDHSVSLARSCSRVGRVFRLSEDYQHVFMPQGRLKSIESLSYVDLALWLPKTNHPSETHSHCSFDNYSPSEELHSHFSPESLN